MTEEEATETTRRKLPLLRIVIGIIITIPLAAIAGVWLFFMYLQWDIDRIRNSVDPACLASATLRVQIADRVFAFPRKDISQLSNKNIVHNSINESTILGTEICQYKNDPPIVVERFRLYPDIQPIICNEECLKYPKHGGRLFGTVYIKRTKPQQGGKKKTQADYIEDCKIKPYFNTCKYFIYYKNTGFHFMYYLLSFPLEEIDKTEQLVLDYLKTHDITETISSNKE